MPLFHDDWLTRNEARGTGDEARDTARRYNEASTHMAAARDNLLKAKNAEDEAWRGRSGTEFRNQTDGLPLLMERSECSTRQVSEALSAFAGQLDTFNTCRVQIQQRGRETQRRLENMERQYEQDSKGVWGDDWWEVGGDMPPELQALRDRMQEAETDLDRLRAEFEAEEECFEDAVRLAVRLIEDADDVLYDSAFQQWWDQHGAKILEVVRAILKVMAVIAAIAALILSGGTAAPLAALIIASALLATSVLKVAGTAAAHGWDNVTTDMWLDVAGDAIGVLTAGVGYKVALAGGDKAPAALKLFAGRVEKAEAVWNLGGAVGDFKDGDYIGGTLGVVGAGLELGGVKGFDNLYSGEAVKIAGGVAGAWEGFDNAFGGEGYDNSNEWIESRPEAVAELAIDVADITIDPVDVSGLSDFESPVIAESDAGTTAEGGSTEWPGLDGGTR